MAQTHVPQNRGVGDAVHALADAGDDARTGNRATSRRGAILATLCLAVFTITLDTTIVNVALPTFVRDLDASTRELQWIVDAYNLVFAALVLAAGSVSDRVGRKGSLLAGLAIFGAGSVIGSLASSPGELIAVRGLIGPGAAIIFPTTLSIIANVFTDRTGRARPSARGEP